MEDFNRPGVLSHYFAYPINYAGQRRYVFCRAMADNNKNRLYVHEVFMADSIKESDTLQTIASASKDGELHGGIALYKAILKNVLDVSEEMETPKSIDKTTNTDDNPTELQGDTALLQNSGVSDDKDSALSEEKQAEAPKSSLADRVSSAEKAEVDESTPENTVSATDYTIDTYTTKKNKTYHRVVFPRADKEVWQERLNLAKKMGGTSVPKGYGFKTIEEAEAFAKAVANPETVAHAQPLSLEDMRPTTGMAQVDVEGLMTQLSETGEANLADFSTPIKTDEAKPETDKPVNPSGNKLVTDERYSELRELMRKKLGGQLNMGVDPEILAIGTEMAVYHIEKGARKFKAYASAMIADLGDAIRPYLKSFYNAVRDMPEAEAAGLVADMDSYDEVRSVDIANFDKLSTDALATAAAVVAEEEAEKQKAEAERKLQAYRHLVNKYAQDIANMPRFKKAVSINDSKSVKGIGIVLYKYYVGEDIITIAENSLYQMFTDQLNADDGVLQSAIIAEAIRKAHKAIREEQTTVNPDGTTTQNVVEDGTKIEITSGDFIPGVRPTVDAQKPGGKKKPSKTKPKPSTDGELFDAIEGGTEAAPAITVPEPRPAADLSGDSAVYQDRAKQTAELVGEIGSAISSRVALLTVRPDDAKPLTMTEVKKLAAKYPALKDISDTDSAFADRMISEIQQSIIAFNALMNFKQFRDASNAKATQNAVEAWKKQSAFDDVSGEPYLPSETFSNFALALAAMYKGNTQKHIQSVFNMMYDIVQGTEQDNLFEVADKTPKPLAEAIRRVLNLEYQPITKPTTNNGTNGSAVLDVNSEDGQDGRPGSDGNADGAEQSQEEAEPSDGGTGTASDSGQGGEIATEEEIETIIASMKAMAKVIPIIEITDKNWRNNITTPLGVVKMGENQKEKLFAKGREQQYGMLLETLGKPDIILEEADQQDNIFHERPSSYLFIKTFQREDGSKYVHFESVTVSQEGMEVSISSHIIRENQLRNKMKSDRLLYKATALDEPANSPAEQPINQGGSLSSDGKDNTLPSVQQEVGSKSSLGERVKAAEAEAEPTDSGTGTASDSGQGGELASQSKLFNYFAGSIKDLIELAKGTATGLFKKIVAPISERLQQDLASYGIEISTEYKHVIDNNAIRHTLKNHGGQQEEKRCQIPLTDSDFERIEDVVSNYDDISVEKGKHNNFNILYSKKYDDGTTIFVEEKRDGRKELAAITMWKKKNSTLTDANRNTTPISDLSEVSDRKVNNSVSEKQEVASKSSYTADESEDDVLCRPVTDKATLDRLNSEPTIKVYRAMQMIDGGLRPPMSGKVDGQWRDATEVGVWEEAEEHPEMADENGRFKLDKGNSKSIKAAYNPYIHTSRSPINDQFSSAWSRPELVTVEVEIPESELTSGYHAEKAKDTVGEKEWKSGPVGRALAKIGQARRVILSRWSRIVRVVPVEEVAEAYAQRLNAHGIEVPFNTVPPALRDALAERGVKIGKPEKGNAGEASMPAFEQWIMEQERLRQGDGYGAYSDAEVSYLNDPVSKVMGKNRFSKKRQAEFAARERQRMVARIQELAERMHLDNVEILTDASQLEGKRAKAKGFYNKRTGKITIVIPNNVSTIDAEQTLLHEAVAHYGLRKLFGEQFDTFLDNVYQSADESIRRKIAEMAAKNGWDFRTATEEYLAGLAETFDFENALQNAGWWATIKRLFLDMLESIGFEGFRDKTGVVLTDNELRYLLWRSYENLTEPGASRSILGEAADVAKQAELKVGNYAERGIEAEYAAEPYSSTKIEEVNNRFNAELRQQINQTLPAGHIYQLGRPGKILRSTGIPDLPIQMSASRLKSKATEYGHDFDISEIKNLVKELQEPIAVFAYGNKGKMQNIVVGIESNGKQFIVGLSLNPVVNGKALEINSIRNVFPKDNAEWLNWITQGKMLYADKEKIQALIDKQRTILADVDYLNLDDVTKIVKSFENPTIEEEELFRPGDFTPRDKAFARREYERMVSSGSYQFQEAVQDSMLGLKKLYQTILGKGTRIENVSGFENAYLFENRMSSMNGGKQHEYFIRYMQPLLKEIAKIAGADKRKRRELTDYLMAKHGLERNEYMRNEAAANGEETDRDFAGLIGLTGEADWQSAEATAQQWVDDYESAVDTTALWQAINNATKATLEKIYLSGIISKETYEKILGMYQFYIPLRGWNETTSEQVYGYLTSKDGPLGGSIMKKAEGRESMADDPIATISMMADDAIRQGNRNLMKQRFLNFILNHPSDAVSVHDIWLEYDDVADEWRPVFADVETTDTPDEVAQKVEAFEQRMEALRNAEPDKYKKGREAQHIPYKVVKGNLREHQILIKRNGRTFVATINGNPRAAQALNGLTNPDVDQNGVVGNMLKAGTWINRQLSAFYTTRNPDFVVSNFFRDMLYSNCMTWVKESPRYALAFHKNFGRVNPVVMRRLLGKWESGTLDMNNRLESLFYQFMINGGETGYTNVRDIEGHKRAIAAELKKQGSVGRKAWAALGMQLDLLNRSAENCARSAAGSKKKKAAS